MVHLRRTLLLPLDDPLAVTREFLNDCVLRSGLNRLLCRDGVGDLAALKPKAVALVHKHFKSYVPRFEYMKIKYLPQMADDASRCCLFVTIDRDTRWVFVQSKKDKGAFRL